MPGTLRDVETSASEATRTSESGGFAALPSRFDEESEPVAGRRGAARGALAGIVLGAAVWAAIVLPVIRH